MKNLTKAQMLSILKKNIDGINILPMYILHSKDYFENKDIELNKIISQFGVLNLIIRSSSKQEDTVIASNAGRYDSILNVATTTTDLMSAIEKVYSSYGNNQNEEILIQPMMQGIIKSGVVFTADIYTYSSYYTINYYEGNDSEAVTSGKTNALKTFISYKESPVCLNDKDMENLILTCKEIEFFLQEEALDIEFAINLLHEVYILQVRPIVKVNKEQNVVYSLKSPLNKIYKKVQKLNKPHPFLLGDKTCFGVMPDWNPAEILGIRPKRLAITLYKELITDNVWAHQRKNYGYRDLTMHPLMVSFCGIPYIDTRITFNSFVPANLSAEITEKLVNYYIKQLAEYPVYHDKIEFEIVFSCYYLNLPQKLNRLLNNGFNENEVKRIEFSLLTLTNTIINPVNGLYKKDINKIATLEKNYFKIINSDISVIDQIYWLIEECKTYGTLPFAGVARAGFIANQFLKSFIELGIISENEYSRYMNSLNTINKKLINDFQTLQQNEITKEEFLKTYGHIRPGTYDILSERYDDNFENYFSNISIQEEPSEAKFEFTEKQLFRIQLELSQNGLLITSEELLIFLREAIEGREYLKFIFTKCVSKILQLIEKLGARIGIQKADLAYLDISLVKQLYVDLYVDNLSDIFMENIIKNKKQFEYAKFIKLPSVIVNPEDVYRFYLLDEEPNFITLKFIEGQVVPEEEINQVNLDGKIVFIQSADPGYDFIFSKGLGGLVTQFGGANSHMAIRCAELKIPAIIGAGEKKYKEWINAKKIQIDCEKRFVTIMSQ